MNIDAKIFNQNISKPIVTVLKKNVHHHEEGFIPSFTRLVKYSKISQCNLPCNRLKKKNHNIMLADA